MLVWGSRGIRYTVTDTKLPGKKVAAAPCSETASAKKVKKFTETCFVAHYYACKFGWNRLRIDGDIRQKAAVTAILENVVIAIYRLRPIQWRRFASYETLFIKSAKPITPKIHFSIKLMGLKVLERLSLWFQFLAYIKYTLWAKKSTPPSFLL